MVFPVVVYASEVQFPLAGRLTFPHVESRMVLVCLAGKGTVTVNKRRCALAEGAIVILPWGHRIAYAADAAEPFLVGGAHLIPAHGSDDQIVPYVAHDETHELAHRPWRRDDADLGSNEVVVGTAAESADLWAITRYAMRQFVSGPPPGVVLRALGELVAHELRATIRRAPQESDLPTDLRRIISYVDHHLDSPITVGTLATVAGYSDATLTRRFRSHLHNAPLEWVTRRRIRRAIELLRTTTLPIGQVARQCGIDDPYYFSRLFRRHLGESPSSWRRTHRLI